MKRTFVENRMYKELERMNVGIDYCVWADDSEGYIYFEEDSQGNVAEAYYETLNEAMVEYYQAEQFHGERISNED